MIKRKKRKYYGVWTIMVLKSTHKVILPHKSEVIEVLGYPEMILKRSKLDKFIEEYKHNDTTLALMFWNYHIQLLKYAGHDKYYKYSIERILYKQAEFCSRIRQVMQTESIEDKLELAYQKTQQITLEIVKDGLPGKSMGRSLLDWIIG